VPWSVKKIHEIILQKIFTAKVGKNAKEKL